MQRCEAMMQMVDEKVNEVYKYKWVGWAQMFVFFILL